MGGTTPAISSIVATVTLLLVSLITTSPSIVFCGLANNFADVWRYVIALRKSPSEAFTSASTTSSTTS